MPTANLRDTFGIAVPTLVLLVSADAPIDSPEVAAAGRELVDKLAHTQGVEQVESFWTSDQLGAALQSKDGRKALIRAQLAGDDNELADRGRALAAQFGGTHGPLHVEATGYAVLLAETEDIAKQDLVKSEVIAIPLTFIALFLIFRGLVAALIPVGIGVLSIVGTTFVMRVLGEITDVSIFAINLASALGLALAIDYSLLIVERYREELQECDRPEAIIAALSTAGRTVVFSGRDSRFGAVRPRGVPDVLPAIVRLRGDLRRRDRCRRRRRRPARHPRRRRSRASTRSPSPGSASGCHRAPGAGTRSQRW